MKRAGLYQTTLILLTALLWPMQSVMGTTTAGVPASAKCTWTVNGTVQVNHQFADLDATYGDISPLEGVKVKVSGKMKTLAGWGWWNKWDQVTTDANGFFTVSKEKTCDNKRRFKVEVKFQSSDLEVRHETATSSTTKVKWYTVHEDHTVERTAHTLDLGTLTFRSNGSDDLSDDEARDHADIWKTYTALIDRMARYGSGFAFDDKLIVKYPHNSWVAGDGAEASYANPLPPQIVYIFRSNDGQEDHLSTSTLLHEAMHIWAYQHSSGEEDLAVNLLASGSTHCFEPTHIAFHEGFAEFAAERLGMILFGNDAPLPFNRNALLNGLSCEGRVDQIASLDKMEEHDFGWMSALRLLVTKDLIQYTFAGTPISTSRFDASTQIAEDGTRLLGGCSPSPAEVRFKQVLSVFLTDGSAGYSHELKKTEMTFDTFFDRAGAILGIDDDGTALLLDLLDPAGTVQPREALCNATLDVDSKVDPNIRLRRKKGNG